MSDRTMEGRIVVRPADERGRADFGWLDSRHSFSFGDYYDPAHMGFRTLRVINEDRVAPAAGFPTHPHRDMEIVTWVIDGALEHRDSMGNGSVIRPGDVQRMSAGTGVTHSEYNAAKDRPVHFLQIWILPERRGLTPGYEQKTFPREGRTGRLALIASRDGREGSVTVHQDAEIHAGLLAAGQRAVHELRAGRGAWIQTIAGRLACGGVELAAGDGAAFEGIPRIELAAASDADFLLFDLGR